MENDNTKEMFEAFDKKFPMHPGSAEWDRAWAELAKRLGGSVDAKTLSGWQYMGPDTTYTKHTFRLRAGVGDNNSGANRWESIDTSDAPAPAPKRKGLLLSVYRWGLGDCTAGGLSSKVGEVLLVDPRIEGVFEETPTRPAVKIGKAGDRLHLRPVDDSGKWYMCGGNIAHSSDSRVTAILPYPVYIHDRTES